MILRSVSLIMISVRVVTPFVSFEPTFTLNGNPNIAKFDVGPRLYGLLKAAAEDRLRAEATHLALLGVNWQRERTRI